MNKNWIFICCTIRQLLEVKQANKQTDKQTKGLTSESYDKMLILFYFSTFKHFLSLFFFKETADKKKHNGTRHHLSKYCKEKENKIVHDHTVVSYLHVFC
jgi:uncharacterized protein (UPF0332 family)